MEYEGRGKNLKRSDVVCSFLKNGKIKKTFHVTGRSFRKQGINNISSLDGPDTQPI